jgi:hypothetical protein
VGPEIAAVNQAEATLLVTSLEVAMLGVARPAFLDGLNSDLSYRRSLRCNTFANSPDERTYDAADTAEHLAEFESGAPNWRSLTGAPEPTDRGRSLLSDCG